MAKKSKKQGNVKASGSPPGQGRRGAEGETGRVLHVGADVGDASFDRDMGEEGLSAVDTGFGLGSSYAAPPNPPDVAPGAPLGVKGTTREGTRRPNDLRP